MYIDICVCIQTYVKCSYLYMCTWNKYIWECIYFRNPNFTAIFWFWGTTYFPGGSDGKASACKAGDPGSIPGSGKSPGEGNGSPLQYSCLGNRIDRGTWWATVHGRVGHDEQLHFHFLYRLLFCFSLFYISISLFHKGNLRSELIYWLKSSTLLHSLWPAGSVRVPSHITAVWKFIFWNKEGQS